MCSCIPPIPDFGENYVPTVVDESYAPHNDAESAADNGLTPTSDIAPQLDMSIPNEGRAS